MAPGIAPRRSWIRRLFGWGGPARPVRRPRRPVLGVEAFEDRVLPAQLVDLGAIALSGDFTRDGDTFTATGQVQVGFAPAGEAFTALIDVTPDAGGSVTFTTGTADPAFTVTAAAVTAARGEVGLPLFQTAGTATFTVAELTGAGAAVTSGAQPFAVAGGTFTLDTLAFFNNPGDPQLRLRGGLVVAPFDSLTLAVTGSEFVTLDSTGVNLTGVSGPVGGSLSLGGLAFDAAGLTATYDAGGGQFVLSGPSSFRLEGNTVGVTFSEIEFFEGSVQQVGVALAGDLAVGGLTFTTDGLTLTFDGDQTFTATGQSSVTVAGAPLAVAFGGGTTSGLVVAGGALTNLDMTTTGVLMLQELIVQAGDAGDPLTIAYTPGSGTYTLTGPVVIETLFGASATLGEGGQDVLTVKDGAFVFDSFNLGLSNVNLGAFTITTLQVAFTPDSFTATLDLMFPGNWTVGGTIGFLDGELNDIGLSLGAGEGGIPIGDTGVLITGFGAEVQNLENPADLIVSGSLTAAWGSDGFVSGTGGFTVSKDELALDAEVSFLNGDLGTATGTLTLDWGMRDYELEVDASYLDDLLTFEAVLDFSDGDELYVKAEADLNVPTFIPFIGGDRLASLDFVLEYFGGRPLADSFVAAWVDFLDLFEVGVKVDFTGAFSVIGSSQIQQIEAPPPATPAPQTYHYDIPFTVPAAATAATLQVVWPDEGGTQSVAVIIPEGPTIPQSEFSAANGLAVVPQLTSGTAIAVGAVNPAGPYVTLPPGNYTLRLISDRRFGTAPKLTASFGHAPPTAAVADPPAFPDGPVAVSAAGKVSTALAANARATFFYDPDGSGYHGTPIDGARNLPVAVDAAGNWTVSATWDTDGLLPLSYYVYARISDGVTGPVYSPYSAAVTPTPALSGTVTDPNNSESLGGIRAYVDANDNGRYDPGDPTTTTGPTGFYAFAASQLPQPGPFFVGVVVPPGFQLHPGSANPVRVTYGGDPLAVNFELDQFASIQGTVFSDLAAGRVGLSGWTVYLDADGDGRRGAGELSTLTNSAGRYAFRDVTLNSTQTVAVELMPGFFQTAPAGPGTYTVEVGPDRFRVYGGNDFGVLPFSTVSGTVTGNLLEDGVLDPTAVPLPGRTVLLESGGASRVTDLLPVAAIDAGGGPAGFYGADAGFTGGDAVRFPPVTIDTTRVDDPAPEAVYQSARFGTGDTGFGYTVGGLTAGQTYAFRLHFAEVVVAAAGQRVFDVAANGVTVLDDVDVFAAAGGQNIAVARAFAATADGDGAVALSFTPAGGIAGPFVSGIEVLRPLRFVTADNAGGPAAGRYSADTGFREGAPFRTAAPVDTGRVGDPAPEAVYQTGRVAPSGFLGAVIYAAEGLTPGADYVVRLHFSEATATGPGQRRLDVFANLLDHVLVGFDVFAAAGGQNVAVTATFTAAADSDGQLLLFVFGGGTADLPGFVNAVEVFEVVTDVAGVATTDRNGAYSFGGLRPGTYTVSEGVPAGFRQVTPFGGELRLGNPVGSQTWTLPGDQLPVDVVVADFNGNGQPDTAVLGLAVRIIPPSFTSNVFVYYDGDFTNPVALGPGGPTSGDSLPAALVAADVFGERGSDLVVLYTGGTVTVLPSRGGALQDGELFQLLPDLGAGGYADVVGGTFYDGVNGEAQFAATYVDNNGNPGAATFYQTGGPLLTALSAGGAGRGPAAGDLNGDGTTDLFVGSAGGRPVVYYGDSNGGFTPTVITSLPAGPQGLLPPVVVVGDVNGDGRLDLGLFGATGLFSYALQDGAGGFGKSVASGVGVPGAGVTAGALRDVNGDFRPDLVWTVLDASGSNPLVVALNTGTAGAFFAPAQQARFPLNTPAVGSGDFLELALGDLDGDGLADLVVPDLLLGLVQLVTNRSTLGPSPIVLPIGGGQNPTGVNFVQVQLGQLNGRVFDDVNRDGRYSDGKPGRAGVTVYLDLNRNGELDPGEPAAATAAGGFYAFAGLPAGSYQVRWVDEPGRRPTTPDGGVYEADLTAPGAALTGLDFGNAFSADVVLTVPAGGGAGDWTVRVRGGRLEVLDSILGVVDSRPVAEVNSLTVVGSARRSDRLTVDLAAGGFFAPAGGITFIGGAGADDGLRLRLGNGDDAVAVTGRTAVVNGRLRVSWSGLERLAVDGGGGGEAVTVTGRRPARGVVTLVGGAGDDVLTAGRGRTVLLGGAGADVLTAGRGRNVLIGGAGSDRLLSGRRSGGAVLVGGGTVHDGDEAALDAILAEWASGRSLRRRVENLTDGGGSRRGLNGGAFLAAADLVDDGSEDVLAGDSRRDWYRASREDRVNDRNRRR